MARAADQREVTCCRCWRAFAVGVLARTITCPLCYQRISLDDILIDSTVSATRLETCGRVVVTGRGRATVKVVRASRGIDVEGELTTDEAGTAGHLYLGPGAKWRGDCRAASVVMHPGAVVRGGLFRIARPDEAAAGSEPGRRMAVPA